MQITTNVQEEYIRFIDTLKRQYFTRADAIREALEMYVISKGYTPEVRQRHSKGTPEVTKEVPQRQATSTPKTPSRQPLSPITYSPPTSNGHASQYEEDV